MKNKLSKLIFLLSIAFVLIFTLTSCQKCAHCEYPATQYSDGYHSSSYCHRAGSGKIIYETAKSDCEVDGGIWVTE